MAELVAETDREHSVRQWKTPDARLHFYGRPAPERDLHSVAQCLPSLTHVAGVVLNHLPRNIKSSGTCSFRFTIISDGIRRSALLVPMFLPQPR